MTSIAGGQVETLRLNLGDCDWFGNAYARWPVNSGRPAETGILGSHRKVRASAIRSAFRVYQGARAVPSWTSAGIRVRPRSFAGPSWFIFLDARRSDGRARIFREWQQYVNLAIGDLLPSFGARRKWHENNISLGPPPLCVETVGLVCAKR
jgi:hypothetical protein